VNLLPVIHEPTSGLSVFFQFHRFLLWHLQGQRFSGCLEATAQTDNSVTDRLFARHPPVMGRLDAGVPSVAVLCGSQQNSILNFGKIGQIVDSHQIFELMKRISAHRTRIQLGEVISAARCSRDSNVPSTALQINEIIRYTAGTPP
jgi:hypothetical protein